MKSISFLLPSFFFPNQIFFFLNDTVMLVLLLTGLLVLPCILLFLDLFSDILELLLLKDDRLLSIDSPLLFFFEEDFAFSNDFVLLDLDFTLLILLKTLFFFQLSIKVLEPFIFVSQFFFELISSLLLILKLSSGFRDLCFFILKLFVLLIFF